MMYFSEIPEGQAIICSNGVYRQVKIVERDGKIYARFGGGFVRLAQGGSTSHIKVRWAEIDAGVGGFEESKGAVWYTPSASMAAE